MVPADILGWSATAVMVGSYALRSPSRLVAAQVVGNALWLAYGVAIHSQPVIWANVLMIIAGSRRFYQGFK